MVCKWFLTVGRLKKRKAEKQSDEENRTDKHNRRSFKENLQEGEGVGEKKKKVRMEREAKRAGERCNRRLQGATDFT